MINTRLYQDKLKDLLDAPRGPTTFTPDNDGEAFSFNNAQATTVQGIEIEFDIKLSHKTRLFASGSLLKISSDDNPETGRSINYEESAPDKSASILMIHDFNQSDTFSLSYYHVGDFSFLDVNNANPQNNRNTGGYNKMDIRFAHNEKHGDEQISTALVLQNMLADYSDYDAVPNHNPITTPAESVVAQNLTAFIEVKLTFR